MKFQTVDDMPQLQGLVQGKRHDYGVAELGWSVPYHTAEGLTATVYVYPCPQPESPTRLTDEFARAVEGLHAGVEDGLYREVTKLGKSPARLAVSQLPVLHESFLLRRDEGSTFSELVLGAVGAQYIKMRGTYPPNQERVHGRMMQRLLTALFSPKTDR